MSRYGTGTPDTPTGRITAALNLITEYGDIAGDHHRAWVVDQIARILTGCPEVAREGIDVHQRPYTYTILGESTAYRYLADRVPLDPGIAP